MKHKVTIRAEGDNSSGKSFLLKKFKEFLEKEGFKVNLKDEHELVVLNEKPKQNYNMGNKPKMKKYYTKDVKFKCDCCGKEFKEIEKLYYQIQNYKKVDDDHFFCCKKHLEKFVRDNSNKKYPKAKNW